MSSFNRFMAWLGLVDEHEPAGDPRWGPEQTARSPAAPPRPSQRPPARPMEGGVTGQGGGPRLVGGSAGHHRPSAAAGMSPPAGLGVVVRPGEQSGAMVGYTETIEARGFDDAKRIADMLRERIPVILDLRNTDPKLVRRLVDFSSGLVYALDGSMRKTTEGVLLVSPPRVKILERELSRLAELGLYDLDR